MTTEALDIDKSDFIFPLDFAAEDEPQPQTDYKITFANGDIVEGHAANIIAILKLAETSRAVPMTKEILHEWVFHEPYDKSNPKIVGRLKAPKQLAQDILKPHKRSIVSVEDAASKKRRGSGTAEYFLYEDPEALPFQIEVIETLPDLASLRLARQRKIAREEEHAWQAYDQVVVQETQHYPFPTPTPLDHIPITDEDHTYAAMAAEDAHRQLDGMLADQAWLEYDKATIKETFANFSLGSTEIEYVPPVTIDDVWYAEDANRDAFRIGVGTPAGESLYEANSSAATKPWKLETERMAAAAIPANVPSAKGQDVVVSAAAPPIAAEAAARAPRDNGQASKPDLSLKSAVVAAISDAAAMAHEITLFEHEIAAGSGARTVVEHADPPSADSPHLKSLINGATADGQLVKAAVQTSTYVVSGRPFDVIYTPKFLPERLYVASMAARPDREIRQMLGTLKERDIELLALWGKEQLVLLENLFDTATIGNQSADIASMAGLAKPDGNLYTPAQRKLMTQFKGALDAALYLAFYKRWFSEGDILPIPSSKNIGGLNRTIQEGLELAAHPSPKDIDYIFGPTNRNVDKENERRRAAVIKGEYTMQTLVLGARRRINSF